MFWEFYQMSAINSADRKAADAEGRARHVENRSRFFEKDLRELQSRVDGLALGCQALWELLCENTSLSDRDIEARMQEIDLRDGKADGKMSTTVRDCPTCHRPVNARRPTCLYCGDHLEKGEHVFDQ